MSKSLLLGFILLLIFAWFLIIERQNFWEKIFVILAIAVIYGTYRVLTGAPMEQIFTPIIMFFKT